MTIEEIVKEIIGGDENYIYGFADMKGLLKGDYKRYRSALVIGRRLPGPELDEVARAKAPTMGYYYGLQENRNELNKMTFRLSKELMMGGYHNLPASEMRVTPAEQEELDRNEASPLSYKRAATRAGLGWIGKTALLVSKSFGPRLRLGVLLLEAAALPYATPIEESACGKCSVCVTNCPGQAANGELWRVGVERDQFFSPHKCKEGSSRGARKALKMDVRTCAVCIAICPQGRH